MVSGTLSIRTIGLALVLLLSLAWLAASFHPRLRFADPNPDGRPLFNSGYACFHDRIYGHSGGGASVVFFGASKTLAAVDAGLIEAVHEAVAGEAPEAFVFGTPISNPGFAYFFFRDYLANNPAPWLALFELTAVQSHLSTVKYVHPYFADLAPPYLYGDILRPGAVVKHGVFAASDLLRLLIRHIDLGLSKLLRANDRVVVPFGDNCRSQAEGAPAPSFDSPGGDSFRRLLDAEMEKLTPPIDREAVGRREALLDHFAEDSTAQSFVERWNDRQRERLKNRFWRGEPGMEPMAERSLDYYQRIVALGEAHGVQVGFYFLPTLLRPEPPADKVERLSRDLGAPVYIMPHWYTRVSYHHYMDTWHVTDTMRLPYAIWFASLIDEAGEG